MVMQGDKPGGARMCGADDVKGAHMLGRNHAKRIGEREMRVGIRVEQDDAETGFALGRNDHGEGVRPQLGDRIGKVRLRGIGETHHRGAVRLKECRERAA